MKKHFSFFIFSSVSVLAVTVSAPASIITLSDVVSAEYGDPQVEDLVAEFHFTLDSGTLPATLTFVVDNRTDETVGYDMSELYFNVPSNVTDVYDGTTGWEVNFLEDGYRANGFGYYDVFLVDGVGGDPHQILPGDVTTFTFTLEGSGPISDTDFITEFTSIPTGDTPTLVAAKFVNGPGDNSGYGAAVPEPTTLLLVLTGGAGLASLRRRHRR